jgi:hypothetical protein
MAEHTPEPWRAIDTQGIWAGCIAAGDDDEVCDMIVPPMDDDEKATEIANANARRIVACVNACVGIETETLEILTGQKPSLCDLIVREWRRQHGPTHCAGCECEVTEPNGYVKLCRGCVAKRSNLP